MPRFPFSEPEHHGHRFGLVSVVSTGPNYEKQKDEVATQGGGLMASHPERLHSKP